MDPTGSPRFLQDLSANLTGLAAMLAHYAESDLRRRRNETRDRVTTAQVGAVLAARHARSAIFGHDLANPGWSLLLELFRADLENRPVSRGRLATDARVPPATAFRWIGDLSASGFVRRFPDPERPKGVLIALTEAGREAMEDYFLAVMLGWSQA